MPSDDQIPEPVAAALAAANANANANDTVITALVGGDGFNGPSHFTFRAPGDKLARMTIRE
jgi:hypothetical protein